MHTACQRTLYLLLHLLGFVLSAFHSTGGSESRVTDFQKMFNGCAAAAEDLTDGFYWIFRYKCNDDKRSFKFQPLKNRRWMDVIFWKGGPINKSLCAGKIIILSRWSSSSISRCDHKNWKTILMCASGHPPLVVMQNIIRLTRECVQCKNKFNFINSCTQLHRARPRCAVSKMHKNEEKRMRSRQKKNNSRWICKY